MAIENSIQKINVLAVDDNQDALLMLESILELNGYSVQTASNGEEAFYQAQVKPPSIILLDVMMPQVDGYELTKRLKSHSTLRHVPVILVSASDSLSDIVAGLDHGADDYVTKPYRPEELLARLRAALRLRELSLELRDSEARNSLLLSQLHDQPSDYRLVGSSVALRNVIEMIDLVAPTNSAVLITGQSGTGKELAARTIHLQSNRAERPFIARNCAAFPESLVESEIFGHSRGSFTGAFREQKGVFELADGGTLFLDEIAEMQPNIQAKLLRVLQDGMVTRVGSGAERQVDVRIIAATNRNLRKMVEAGSFREDLFYRLNVIQIAMPSLETRREDIPLIAQHILSQLSRERGREFQFSQEVLCHFTHYSWPGNVRELRNEIERLVILAGERNLLDINLLSPHVVDANSQILPLENAGEGALRRGILRTALEDLERVLIRDALKAANGNRSLAAKQLGMSRSNLISKLRQYRLIENDPAPML